MDSFCLTTIGSSVSPDGSLQSASSSSSSCADKTMDVWNNLGTLSTITNTVERKPVRSRKSLKTVFSLCAVCDNEQATVSYFGSRICTACRAYFRRSVKSAKTYQCLNNDLCKKGPNVSNRLACKFCRFQRCCEIGMLEKKLMLHSEHPGRHKENASDLSFPLVQLDVFIDKNTSSAVLSEFCILRRKISFERYNTYHGKDTRVTIRKSQNALHDWYEYDLLDSCGSRCELFSQLPAEDWEELMTADYSIIWVMFSQCQFTLRNNGQEDKRAYLVDESFLDLRDETTDFYWNHIYEAMSEDEDRDHIFQIVRSYLLMVINTMVYKVTVALGRAKLDDTELSALLMLMFCSPSAISVISDHSRKLLREWREETLRGIGEHIERTGRNVDERMAEIIFLLGEFQNMFILAKNAVQLSLVATKGASMPLKFRDLINRSNNRRLKSRVMQRLFGDLDLSSCPVN
ncbi:Nuclear receptor domain-containing protein [Aphelenchoides besseyi]|nr:Nuclear receptor domain-containing protein [Aphelenchoides besseyi]KAI6212179.1 Nuclear receptor domain-containing protein [Aphelenchoides besseyi]